MGSLFSLRLQLGIREIPDLERTLKLLRKKLGLSGQGSFAIHQGSMGWYGFGFQTFLTAVKEQKARYDELKWKSYHHSEELAYADRLDGGGLICVSSRQGTGQGNHLHSSDAEVYFPGIPVQMSSIRELCALTGNDEAFLEMVKRRPLQTVNFRPWIKVEPVAAILSDTDGRWTSGVVIKNPFLKSPMPVDAQDDEEPVDQLKRMIPTCEFLFCALRQWHKSDRLMDEYELCSVEGCWIAHYYAMHVVCDWKQ